MSCNLDNGDLRAAHHASPREHGVMDRVGLYVAVTPNEFDLDYNQVMYVLQIFPNTVFGVLGTTSSNDHVSSGTPSNLVCDMFAENKMTVCPFNENLVCR